MSADVSNISSVEPIFLSDDYILISNDDGFFAPGIKLLQKVVAEFSDYCVFAPQKNCSGASSCLTLHSSLVINHIEEKVFAVNGMPADCVHSALNGLLANDPKRVVSGINSGANLGDDVLYSGTVAAALEGRFMAKHSIAFSITEHQPKHWETAEFAVRWVLSHIDTLDKVLPERAVLNVNIPDIPLDELKGYKITRLGQRGRGEDLMQLVNPRGVLNYWIGLSGDNQSEALDTDFAAIEQGYVSLTPIRSDLTDETLMANLRDALSL